MILEMGCKLRILSLKFQLKLQFKKLAFMVRPSPILPPFQSQKQPHQWTETNLSSLQPVLDTNEHEEIIMEWKIVN
jgi:hypothetical protein